MQSVEDTQRAETASAKHKQMVLTGFGKFNGVEENPTSLIIKSLEEKKSLNQVDLTIIDVSVEGVTRFHDCSVANGETITVHLGVNSHGKLFQLEQFAYNNMSFRVADESGFQPVDQAIDNNQPFDCRIQTDFPLQTIVDSLTKEGFPVEISLDPGRFVCNYVYYTSMLGKMSKSSSKNVVFVHVPPVDIIPLEDQIVFVEKLIDTFSQLYSC
mmetsp:Transcript_15667/g.15795  ORF Transcript_15667/g.15795 Transcript_15667/m.15795 type:complete len:213 (-) Transcript_15667:282-920(-)